MDGKQTKTLNYACKTLQELLNYGNTVTRGLPQRKMRRGRDASGGSIEGHVQISKGWIRRGKCSFFKQLFAGYFYC